MKASSIGIVVDKTNAARDWHLERKISIIGADKSKWMTVRTADLTPEQKKIPMFNNHTFPDCCSLNTAVVNKDVWKEANQPTYIKILRNIIKAVRLS